MNYLKLKLIEFNPQFPQILTNTNKHYLLCLCFSLFSFCLYAQNEVANGFGAGSQNNYYSIGEIYAKMDQLANTYPNICSPKFSIGNTVQGRPIYALKISDNPNIDEPESTVYYDSAHHGNEKISVSVTINYMMWLCEQYALNTEVKYLIDNREIYFVPVVSVDGYIKGKRKNERPPFGSCEYDHQVGVDLNRNYPIAFGNEPGSSGDECNTRYRGISPFSEPETRAVRDFVATINPTCAFSTHSSGAIVLMPSGSSPIPTAFNIYADLASEMYADNNYIYGTTKTTINYVSAGTTRDYLHSVGIIAYTPEIRNPDNNIESIKSIVAENVKPMRTLAWLSGAFTVVKNHKLLGDIIPGSTFDMLVAVKNKGNGQTAENVTVSVTSNNSKIAPVSNIIQYNNIQTQQLARNNSNPFTFTVSSNAQIGETAILEISVAINGVQTDLHKVPVVVGEKNTLLADDAEFNTSNWTLTGNLGLEAGTETPSTDAWGRDNANSYSGTYSFSESKNGLGSMNQSAYYTTNSINLNSTNSLKVQFAAKWSLGTDYTYPSATNDSVILQANSNNSGWIDIETYTQSSDWVYKMIDLSGYPEGSLSLRFWHQSDGLSTGDGFYFDDFEIVEYLQPSTCRQIDSLALVAVYDALNGNQWDFTQPMDTWTGVTLNTNGCVYGLNLSNSGLSGTLAPQIGDLSEIRNINFTQNSISGTIPSSIGDLSNLESVYLHNNLLTGSMPSEMGDLANLKFLSLRNNQLTGDIPATIGGLTNLESLSLSNNQLTGNIPSSVGNLTNLNALHLSKNQLTGNIPTTIGGMTNLESFYVSNNQLTGNIPATIGNLSNLEYLYLNNNQLTGNIPTTIGNLSNLVSLNAPYNQLTGSIPSSIGDFDSILSLNLHDNQLTGEIPSTIGNLVSLTSLYLRDNQLTGNIPGTIGELPNLNALSLSNNQLSGNIPVTIGNLVKLNALYLSNNQLTGNIPATIVNLTNLNALTLNDNQMTGSIPESLADIGPFSFLTLQNNQFSGCYANELNQLCDNLASWNSRNAYISNGNNFSITWEVFCAIGCGDRIEQEGYILTTQSSPNPFTDHATITYTLPKDSPVTLTVYDSAGREAAVLHNNEVKTAGTHTAVFRGDTYPSGMYYYTIQAGEYFGTQKMILAR